MMCVDHDSSLLARDDCKPYGVFHCLSQMISVHLQVRLHFLKKPFNISWSSDVYLQKPRDPSLCCSIPCARISCPLSGRA